MSTRIYEATRIENEADLLKLGILYEEIKLKMNELESEKERIKALISDILIEEGVAQVEIPTEDGMVYKFKNNTKFTKSFDKDGFAEEIDWDRDDIDYVGISKAVEEGYANPDKVAEFQKQNKSNFITVRKTKYKAKKRGY